MTRASCVVMNFYAVPNQNLPSLLKQEQEEFILPTTEDLDKYYKSRTTLRADAPTFLPVTMLLRYYLLLQQSYLYSYKI